MGWAVFGLVATTGVTAVMILAQLAGRTRLDLPLMLGTMTTEDPDRARVAGFATHWWCVSRFDDPPLFGRLVGGNDAGSFSMSPNENAYWWGGPTDPTPHRWSLPGASTAASSS